MLWYKAWLETRWIFFMGLASFILVSAIAVLMYPVTLRRMAEEPDVQGRFLFLLHDMSLMKKGYASYIWSGWFGNHLPALWTIFALLMGFSSLASERATGIATYTLSLPTNRRRLLTVQATASAVQLSILALVSSLLVPALSPLIGQSYAVGDALLHAMLVIAGGMVLLAFAFLLSYRLGNEQVTGAIAWAVVGVLWALSLTEPLAPYSIFRMMGGESYFFQGTLPWAGLSISMIVAAALFSTTIRIAERQDF